MEQLNTAAVFGSRLTQLQREKGITPITLARALDVSVPTLWSYLRGEREPEYHVAENAAQYFDVSYQFMIGLTEERKNTIMAAQISLNNYQMLAGRTINSGLNAHQIEMHAVFGLEAEVGEIHSLYQKQYQGHGFSPERAKEELGDVLWFVSEYATSMGWTLEEVATANINKLLERYAPDKGFTEEQSVHRDEYNTAESPHSGHKEEAQE